MRVFRFQETRQKKIGSRKKKKIEGWILLEIRIGEIQGVKFVTQRMFVLLINSSVLEELAKAVS
jgi:hypothetical protein